MKENQEERKKNSLILKYQKKINAWWQKVPRDWQIFIRVITFPAWIAVGFIGWMVIGFIGFWVIVAVSIVNVVKWLLEGS